MAVALVIVGGSIGLVAALATLILLNTGLLATFGVFWATGAGALTMLALTRARVLSSDDEFEEDVG